MTLRAWIIEKSEYILSTKWLSLIKQQVKTSNGNIIPDFYIIEENQWAMTIPIIRSKKSLDNFWDHHVLMIKQYRHGANRVSLEFPAGQIDTIHSPKDFSMLNHSESIQSLKNNDENSDSKLNSTNEDLLLLEERIKMSQIPNKKSETVITAAFRELREETGAENIEFIANIGSLFPEPARNTNKGHCVLVWCDWDSNMVQRLDEHESIDVVSLPLRELFDKIVNGEVIHGAQLGFFMKAFLYLTNRFGCMTCFKKMDEFV